MFTPPAAHPAFVHRHRRRLFAALVTCAAMASVAVAYAAESGRGSGSHQLAELAGAVPTPSVAPSPAVVVAPSSATHSSTARTSHAAAPTPSSQHPTPPAPAVRVSPPATHYPVTTPPAQPPRTQHKATPPPTKTAKRTATTHPPKPPTSSAPHSSPPPLIGPVLTAVERTIAYAVLAALNVERAAHTLRPLTMNGQLMTSARAHDLTMAKFNTMSHQLPGEPNFAVRISNAGYKYSTAGENIAWNTDSTTGGALYLESMMYEETPPDNGHRLNILSSAFTDVGIDIYLDLTHGKLWMTEDFARH